MTLTFDLWPWKSIGFQILWRTKYVPSLVKIHWRMLILECSQGCYGRTDGQKNGSVTISLRNFVGEGIINFVMGINWKKTFIKLIYSISHMVLCNNFVLQWCLSRIVAGRWFSLGTPVSYTIKTDHLDISEILLIVALNTITLPPSMKKNPQILKKAIQGNRSISTIVLCQRSMCSEG